MPDLAVADARPSEPNATERLTPAQVKAAKKAAQLEFLAELRRKRAERDAKEPTAPPAADAPIERSETDRRRDLAVFLAGVWLVLRGLARLFGYTLDPLSDEEASADARAWVPVAERYPKFDRLCVWVAAPVNIVRRVASKLHPRTPEPQKAAP